MLIQTRLEHAYPLYQRLEGGEPSLERTPVVRDVMCVHRLYRHAIYNRQLAALVALFECGAIYCRKRAFAMSHAARESPREVFAVGLRVCAEAVRRVIDHRTNVAFTIRKVQPSRVDGHAVLEVTFELRAAGACPDASAVRFRKRHGEHVRFW